VPDAEGNSEAQDALAIAKVTIAYQCIVAEIPHHGIARVLDELAGGGRARSRRRETAERGTGGGEEAAHREGKIATAG
jgi:hypothetical protein